MSSEEVAVVGPREPCPCGSGRRYKACHGKDRAPLAFVARPFEGLPNETEWVALREIVPAAVGKARLKSTGEEIVIASLLPNSVSAIKRTDGVVMLALQVQTSSGDASRDMAAALTAILKSEAGSSIVGGDLTNTSRLQDLLDLSLPFTPETHANFDFWFTEDEMAKPETKAALEEFEGSIIETERIRVELGSAFWCAFPDRTVVRWLLPHDEERSLNALARLAASDELNLGNGTRYLGAFRADGLLVPVFDVQHETPIRAFELALTTLSRLFLESFEKDAPLTSAERRARAGLVGRQLTIR